MARLTLLIAAAAASAAAAAAASAAPPPPNGQACVPPNNTAGAWCDVTLPTWQRVEALLAALTLDEKISLMQDGQPAIDRLQLPFFSYNTEALHGLGAYCIDNYSRCPSIFPAPPALGAAFNNSLMLSIGAAISDEVRAFANNGGIRHYDNRTIAPTVWVPSINLAVNPLWGRNVEVYGEDPWHAGMLAAFMVQGVQHGLEAPPYAYLKASGGDAVAAAATARGHRRHRCIGPGLHRPRLRR